MIREAVANDYEIIGQIFLESDDFHASHQPDIYKKSDVLRSKDYIVSVIEDPKNLFFVVEERGEVIGFITGNEESKGFLPFHRERTFFQVDNLVIKKEYQGMGYGTSLLKRVIHESRKRGYSDITLNVYSFNKGAIGLYENIGFKEVSKEMMLKLL